MWGILYLILACVLGYKLIQVLFPQLVTLEMHGEFDQKVSGFPKWMVVCPAAFITGTLLMTWTAYIFACLFAKTGRAMLYGNIAAFVTSAVLTFLLCCYDPNGKKNSFRLRNFNLGKFSPKNFPDSKNITGFISKNRAELLFTAFVLVISSFYIFRSFFVRGGNIYTGFSVYSDFGPHLAMIRSFSLGNNFPTGYPHYADDSIRYHFMFQFLAGNLEYLGLRIDWAFNLPSILSLLSFLMLLYSLGLLITGSRAAAFITGVLFFFRSSAAFFTFLAGESGIKAAVDKILTGDSFIGYTSHEDWGLWSFKDYINQRHFTFSMGVLIMAVILYLPRVSEMAERLGSIKKKGSIRGTGRRFAASRAAAKHGKSAAGKAVAENGPGARGVKIGQGVTLFLLDKNAWLPQDTRTAVATGLLIGSIAYWHGSLLISTLLILFVMAMLSTRRLEYLYTALISVALSFVQTRFFTGDSGSVVKPQLVFGFLADKRTLEGVISYYFELLGVLPIVVAAGIILARPAARRLAFAFLAPLVFATVVTLVPDIAINHKYVAASVILLNIFASGFLVKALKTRKALPVACAAVLAFLLTVTGIANNITIYNMDKNRVKTPENHPVKEWVEHNTETSAVFLTSNYVTHPILMAGRKIFNGYQYFAGSAGYDTAARDRITAEIFGSSDIEHIRKLLEENGLDYIVIDNSVRSSNIYRINEELFDSNFELAYSYPPENGLKIYRVR